jgi:outer membrane lipase/esterase
VWAAANANQTYLFADGIHPTTAAHAIIAQFVEQLISGPHQYSLLAEVPLHSRQGHLRALSDGLTLGRRNAGGERWNVFASIDHGELEIDAGPGVQGLDNRGNSGTVGITTNISDAATIGIAVGQSKSRYQFAAGIGNFNTNDKVLSLFGSVRMGGFWGTAVASISELTYGEIRRVVTLGPATRTTSARTDGSNASGQVFAGYDFGWRGFTIGPVVGVTVQNVEINGFDETEIGATSATSLTLRMAGQTRKSEVWSAGARASLRLGGWTPWVSATYDKERRDDVRVVTATPMTLGTGNSFDVPAYMPDTSYTTLAAGIRGQIDRFGIAAAYTTVQSRSGIRDDGVTLLLSYRF